MGKYKNSLVTAVEERKKLQEEQNKLKEKHGIKEENVIVVEKTNMLKFLIRSLGTVIRVSATILLLMLAAVGLFTLAYVDIRTPFLTTLHEVLQQFFSFL